MREGTNQVDNSFSSPRDLKMLEMLDVLGVRCVFTATDANSAEPDPQCLHDEVTEAVRKAALYVLSFRAAFKGGDPVDNYRTLYPPHRFPRLNREVDRKTADEGPLNHQSRYFETSGLLRVPAVVLKTRRNPVTPEWQAAEYKRKQQQLADDAPGARVIVDEVEKYFGNAHTIKSPNTDLSEQLDILTSIVAEERKVSDVALRERTWKDKPKQMVSYELAQCPSQVAWLGAMLKSVKSAIKQGTLPTTNRIAAMISDQAVLDAAAASGDAVVTPPVAAPPADAPPPPEGEGGSVAATNVDADVATNVDADVAAASVEGAEAPGDEAPALLELSVREWLK